jgi:hypothetical protein
VPPGTPPGTPYGAPASTPHAAAPGVGYAPVNAPGAAPHGFPEAGGPFQPEPAAGWAQAADQSGTAGPAQNAWFFDEGNDDVHADAMEDAGAGGAVRRMLPGAFDLMPTIITFFITCMSVLLVVASLMWRPDVP